MAPPDSVSTVRRRAEFRGTPRTGEGATVTDLAEARRARAGEGVRPATGSSAPGALVPVPDFPSAAPALSPSAAPALSPSVSSGESPKRGARKPANRRFDKEKVERLKAQIADGSYEIDSVRVADRFIEHERNG